MKQLLILLTLLVVAFQVNAQAIRRLHVDYDTELSQYTLEFDIKPDKKALDKQFFVVIKAKNDELIMHPTTATGSGLYFPVTAGKSYRIIWNPQNEGLDPKGWGFHVKLVDANQEPPQPQKQIMDHPLVIVASYLFIFSAMYLFNVLNH